MIAPWIVLDATRYATNLGDEKYIHVNYSIPYPYMYTIQITHAKIVEVSFVAMG
jgi:hypothetical protein